MRGLRDAGLCTNVARLMTFARSSLRRIVGVGVLVLGTAAVAAMTGTGCDDTTDGTGGSADCLDAKGCFDYTCYKPGATRSFKTDVLPIFEQSCSLSSSCHGNPKSPMTAEGYQMYLGEVDPTPATTTDESTSGPTDAAPTSSPDDATTGDDPGSTGDASTGEIGRAHV